MDMNQRIRQYIKSNGKTFTLVAEKAGIELKKFSRMMTGRQKIDTDEYELICKALSVAPTYFFAKKFLETQNLSA